jgi:hypothetical protein
MRNAAEQKLFQNKKQLMFNILLLPEKIRVKLEKYWNNEKAECSQVIVGSKLKLNDILQRNI